MSKHDIRMVVGMRYHDFNLVGYSVRQFGSEIVLHLRLELPSEPAAESHVRFADVAAYHFIHAGVAIIGFIWEVPIAMMLERHWPLLSEQYNQLGAMRHWDNDRLKYQAKLEAEAYRAYIIDSAMGFDGFVIAKRVEDATGEYARSG